MKRPKTSSKKMSWFNIAGVFLLAVALAVGATTSAQAASGSFDRDAYVPPVEGSNSDFERAWITVTDSTANLNTSSVDNITVTIKSSSTGVSATYKLYETGPGSSTFTTTGASLNLHATAIGSVTGYVEDFAGSRLVPGLGTQTYGAVNIKTGGGFTAQNGDVGTSPSSTNNEAILTVSSSDTLQLLYGGSTLDTAPVAFFGADNSSFTLSDFTAWGTTVSGAVDDSSNATNFKITLVDHNENINPKLKDIIGFADGFTVNTSATGTSRVEVQVLDQSSSTYLSYGSTDVVTRNIQLVETGVNSGTFEATGKVYGSSAASLKGNVRLGTTTASYANGYEGSVVTLGTLSSTDPAGGVSFRILEISSGGKLSLVNGTQSATATFGTVTLQYDASSDGGFFGTSTWDLDTISAGWSSASGSGSAVLSIFGAGASSPVTNGIVKLVDGTNYCLVDIEQFFGTGTAANNGATTIIAGNNSGSITVSLDNFIVGGPRSGDTIRVAYLDALTSSGVSGTVTSSKVFGTTGVAGALSVDKTTADINDTIVVTVADANLNSSTSTQQSIVAGSWNGTTTGNRGDKLNVMGFKNTAPFQIDLSYPDNTKIAGTQTVRISSTDNSLVWMVPSNATGFAAVSQVGSVGSSTFALGTQSTSSIPLVRGSTSSAQSYLTSASTSSFNATVNGLDGTVEISPDGTRWIAVPIVETGIDTGTFVGTVGFDCTAVRLTTSTTVTVSQTFTDSTGTTTITFQDPTPTALTSTVGTGSVVRIYDGTNSEFQEVTAVTGSTLQVTKMSNSTSFTSPHQTWVQVIGDDMVRTEERSGNTVFLLGGYYGATYRIRYNDATGASNAYAGGDTLAVTTSNVGFKTYTGTLAVDPSGTVGMNSQIVITMVDEDLNTSITAVQTTVPDTNWSAFVNNNEVGLGNPIGTSSTNNSTTAGKIGKEIFVSIKSSPSSSDFKSTTNTVPVTLLETAVNTGTFKGTLQLGGQSDSTTSASTTPPRLKVSSGDTVTIFYNDSPSATAENNLSNYTTVSVYPVGGAGVLTMSKDTAYLSGDTIVATVVDADRNTGASSEETMTSSLKVTGSNYSIGTDLYLNLKETGVNTGTFVSTITTIGGTTTSAGGGNSTSGTLPTVQSGIVSVSYIDTVPSASTSTKTLNLSAYDATLNFDADSYSLGNYALVTLADAEQNTNATTAGTLLSSVFIQTSSSNATKVKVVENGVDTGTFVGSIKVASSGGTTEYNQIQAAEGEMLTITYIDQQNTSGSSQTRTDTASVTAAVATPTPAVSPSPGASPVVTATPTVAPTVTLPPITPLPTVTLPPITPLPSITLPPITPLPSPSPVVSPSPEPECEAETISVSPSKLTLKKKKSGSVTVTVTGDEGCAVEGETVTVTLTSASKKRVSVTPTSASTDASGQATFTITAKKKTGNARVTFKVGSVKKSITVKVK